MANTTGGDKVFTAPWTAERHLKINATIPASSTTFYAGQAVGRDASGTMCQMDDTAKAEFIGILSDLVRTTVYSDDTAGDKVFLVEQPQMFTAKIAAASAGQEGRRVYWTYNNEVAYTTGSYGNFAGWVWQVKDSTHVTVIPPWMGSYNAGGYVGTFSAAAAATTTLTKFDINKVIVLPLTASSTINLPAVATLSPGDKLLFVNTSANSSVPTLDGNSSETINGSATYTMSSSQYATVELVCTGSAWVVNVPSLTTGGTTFTGNVVLDSGADLTFTGTTGQPQINLTDNLADALSVCESSNDYLVFVTTDSAEQITLCKDLAALDDVDLTFGTGLDAQIRWSTGDASNHVLVIALDDTSQSLHVTDKGAIGTDWNLSANTHPNLYLHSNTTPATDYLRLGDHDGTEADIDVVGGTSLALKIAGTEYASVRVTGLAAGTYVAAATPGTDQLTLKSTGTAPSGTGANVGHLYADFETDDDELFWLSGTVGTATQLTT